MTSAPTDCRVPDPTDAKADGGFGNHRAGYSPDRLAQAEYWARKGGTLAAGEGLVLCAEIDRLRKDFEIATSMLSEQVPLLNRLQDENDWLRGILAKLREPSEAIVRAAQQTWDGDYCHMGVAIRAAVAAAEREVQYE
jgi:hypothetical protein